MNEKRYITISEVNNYLKKKFDNDTNLQKIFIKGEISNFKNHTRGHLYFTLKDENSRINAVMFSYQASSLKFIPEDGMKVLVEGKLSVYEATGNYQIYIDKMDNEGQGDLFKKFEELKKKLNAEGLFNEDRKKKIPKFPNKIGVITAPTGAAIKDIISTIKRRYPIAEVILFPSLVQGAGASKELSEKLKIADTYNLDVIIFGRGGGSIEDLWGFNEEIVARTLYEMKTPVISAVGHEIDFTISDFVADLRAPTPTGAAEMAVPNLLDVNNHLNNLTIRLNRFISNKLQISNHQLNNLKKSYVLENPLSIYEIKEQKLSNIIDKLNNTINYKIHNSTLKYNNIMNKQIIVNPKIIYQSQEIKYNTIIDKLTLLNPLNILNKGYSVVKKNNKVIKSVKDLKENDIINIRLHEGEIISTIKEVI